MKPSSFNAFPFGSVKRNHESEVVAFNIMKILSRTGDEFREITFDEYEAERKKDGGYTKGERGYFDDVIGYFKSADTACLFSSAWKSC